MCGPRQVGVFVCALMLPDGLVLQLLSLLPVLLLLLSLIAGKATTA